MRRNAPCARFAAARTRRRASHAAKPGSIRINGPRSSTSRSRAGRDSRSVRSRCRGLKRYSRGARRELQHPEARRAVHRVGNGRLRAPPRRQRLFRERAGVDRCGVRQSRRRDGARFGDRGADASLRRRAVVLDRHGVRRPRQLHERQHRRARAADAARRAVSRSSRQLAKVAFTWPPTASKWLDSVSVGAQRTDFQNNEKSTAGVDFQRRGVDERAASALSRGACSTTGRSRPARPPSSAHATYLEAGYVLRRVDDLLSPTRGFMADVRVGGGIPGLSTEGFGRVVAQAAAWYPIDRTTQLAFRADAGAVFVVFARGRTVGAAVPHWRRYDRTRLRVPEPRRPSRRCDRRRALLRDRERRGDPLDQRDLGHCRVRRRGQRRGFDPRLQVSHSAMGWARGLRTPIGPFRLDVAYGEETREWRLHFSVGLTF